jgi:hypothetical protein
MRPEHGDSLEAEHGLAWASRQLGGAGLSRCGGIERQIGVRELVLSGDWQRERMGDAGFGSTGKVDAGAVD